jgi:hypothetical protein
MAPIMHCQQNLLNQVLDIVLQIKETLSQEPAQMPGQVAEKCLISRCVPIQTTHE